MLTSASVPSTIAYPLPLPNEPQSANFPSPRSFIQRVFLFRFEKKDEFVRVAPVFLEVCQWFVNENSSLDGQPSSVIIL